MEILTAHVRREQADLVKVQSALRNTLDPLKPWLSAVLPNHTAETACAAAIRVSALRLAVVVHQFGTGAMNDERNETESIIEVLEDDQKQVEVIMDLSLSSLSGWQAIKGKALKYTAEGSLVEPRRARETSSKSGKSSGWKGKLFGKAS